MDLRVLGPLEAVEDGLLLPLGGIKQRTVLALLIAHGGRPVSTDALIDGVYGEDAPSGARRSVQTYVSNLRGQLGDVIKPSGSGYVLGTDLLAIDAYRFEELLSQADGLEDPGEAADLLRQALAMWRGHPYGDVDGLGVIPSEVSRLNELRVVAVERRVEADLDLGRHAEVVGELESLTAANPLRERFHGQHMVALYRSGRQADALRAFEKTRVYLAEELGLDPSPQLRTLERQILEQDPALGYRAKPTILRAAVLVADIDDPSTLTGTNPASRVRMVDRHSELVTRAIETHNGQIFAQRGTAVYSWFASATDAAAAAEDAQWSLVDVEDPGLRLRVAIDFGDVERVGGDGVQGPPVSRAAALVASARGGNVLLAASAQVELTSKGGDWQIRGLGTPEIEGLEAGTALHLLVGGWPSNGSEPLRRTAILPAPPERGHGIPGYEWRDRVGSGAFGVVHRAYQPAVGREVAIKKIRPELADHPSFIRRFEVEAQLVARLEHPHIVPLYDFWRDADGAFLVMRWMGGGSLKDRLRDGPIGFAETSRLVSQIGPALGAAHRKGVVHRDLRAENILSDEDDNWYLSDFGVAYVDAPDGGNGADLADLGRLIADCIRDDDRASEVLPVVEGAVRGDFSEVAPFLEAWDRAVGIVPITIGTPLTEVRNPYKGLDAFGELDADDFHGRDALVAELVATVAERRLVGVVGPSGIGKSSVVRAGLLPAVRDGLLPGSGEWLITDMVPTAYPFEQLASALERVTTRTPADLEERLRKDRRGLLRAAQRYVPRASTLLLVVDQFEELFTLVPDEATRAAFLDLLAETANDPNSAVRIVLTIRADFFDRPLRYAEFGELLRSGTVPASAPTDDELHDIIAKPAAGVGVAFEPGLVDRIVADVGGQPGTLPLLEFALTRLFEYRSSDVMTSADYDRVGGVLAALGRRAEQVFKSQNDSSREVVRQVFVRLVNVNEDGRATRRRIRMTELARLGFSSVELHDVVDPLVEARLLTLDRDPVTRGPTVEVAHEALLTEWPRLAEWIETQQEDLVLYSRLASAVADWEASGRSGNYLLRAGRLEQHEAWTAETELSLTSVEREFLEASRRAEDERRAQRRRVRRRVLAGFGAAAVFASILAVAALVAFRAAERGEREAHANELAAAAISALDQDPELGLMLAIASSDVAEPGPNTANALHKALQSHRTVFARTLPAEDSPFGVALGTMSPDGHFVAVGGAADTFEVWSVLDGDAPLWIGDAGHPEMSIVPMGFTEDSETLIAEVFSLAAWDGGAGPDGVASGIAHFDVASGEQTRFVEYESQCALDGQFVHISAVDLSKPVPMIDPGSGGECQQGVIGDVVALDLMSGAQTLLATGAVIGRPAEDVVSMTPDARLVAIGGAVGEVVDIASGEVLLDYPGGLGVLNDAGTLVLSGYETITVWDVVEGVALTSFGREGEFTRAGFTNGDMTVWAVSRDGSMKLFDVATGAIVLELIGHTGRIMEANMSRDGSAFASFAADSAVRIWTLLDRIPEVETGVGSQLEPMPSTHRGAFVDGDRAFLARGALIGQQIQVVDVVSGSILAEMSAESVFPMTLSPDGSKFAFQVSLPSQDEVPEGVNRNDRLFAHVGPVGIYDTDSGELLMEMGGICSFYMSDEGNSAPPGCGESGRNEMPAVGNHLSFSADGAFLAMDTWFRGDNGRGGETLVWDTTTGEIVFDRIGDEAASAGSPVFSPDGSLLVLGSDSGTASSASVWDTATWTEIEQVPVDQGWHDSFFTPDGSLLVFADWGGKVVVIDTETWEVSGQPIEAHDGLIRSMDMAADGSLLVTAANDGFVRVWDVQDRALVQQYDFGDEDFASARFMDNDTRLLVTPLETGVPIVMFLDVDDLLQSARSRITRGFTPEECATYNLDLCPTLEAIRIG